MFASLTLNGKLKYRARLNFFVSSLFRSVHMITHIEHSMFFACKRAKEHTFVYQRIGNRFFNRHFFPFISINIQITRAIIKLPQCHRIFVDKKKQRQHTHITHGNAMKERVIYSPKKISVAL